MKQVNNKTGWYALAVFSLLLLAGCNVTRFLEEDERLYTGSTVEVDSDSLKNKQASTLKTQLESQVTPKPNSSFLGMWPQLWFYYTTKEPEKQKGFRYWKKYQLGEEPVLMSDVDMDFNRKLLENYSQNKGYFQAEASYDTLTNDKKTEVHYRVKPHQRYYIDSIDYELSDSTIIGQNILDIREESLLEKDNPFDLDVIKSERNRIDAHLKNNGFYYFNADHLIVQADTTNGDHEVEMFVNLKDDMPSEARQQYTIDKVVVYPNYSFSGDENQRYPVPTNTDSIEIFNDIYLIDPEDEFRQKVFDEALHFRSGDLYNRKDHNLSLNRLISLGVFKFVKNQFYRSDSLANTFDAYYLLTPQEFQSLQAELLGSTNSANYAGSELNINWRHRNFFKGAELFQLETFGAFNVQLGGPQQANNIFRYGAEASLKLPRIVAPFHINSSSEFVPRTNFNIGYEFQNRTSLYTLQNFNAGAGYLWKEDARKEHEFKLTDISYVYAQNVTEKYREQAQNNVSLQRVVDDQLIFGPSYRFTFTNTMLPRKHTFFYEGKADFSGNILGLVTGANFEDGNQKNVFGVPFSQYVKTENDFRYYMQTGENSSLATRLVAGIAYPYGNSDYIPFSRQFFVGGSNSIRGFRARTLGPGSYDPRTQDADFLFDQSGDIKLETSVEYRPNIYKFLEGALFLDAGNIWLVNENDELPGGQFTNNFFDEMAVSGGVGLRFDFSVVLLRLDLATPLRKPYLEGDKWTFDDIDFGNKQWRQDNLLLNIAIGYPF